MLWNFVSNLKKNQYENNTDKQARQQHNALSIYH